MNDFSVALLLLLSWLLLLLLLLLLLIIMEVVVAVCSSNAFCETPTDGIGLIVKLTFQLQWMDATWHQERQKYEVLREEKNDAEMEANTKRSVVRFFHPHPEQILMWESLVSLLLTLNITKS